MKTTETTKERCLSSLTSKALIHNPGNLLNSASEEW